MVASSVPVAVKSSGPLRWPSWNTHTMAPKVADRLSRLRMSALIGITTVPNSRNSSTKVMTAMMPAASGSSSNSDAFVSTSCADCPATCTVERRVGGADVRDERLALGRQRLDVGHDRQVGAAAGVGGGEAEVAAVAAGQHELPGLRSRRRPGPRRSRCRSRRRPGRRRGSAASVAA